MSSYTSNPDACQHEHRMRNIKTAIITERCEGCGLVRNMVWAPWRNPTKRDLKDTPLERDNESEKHLEFRDEKC